MGLNIGNHHFKKNAWLSWMPDSTIYDHVLHAKFYHPSYPGCQMSLCLILDARFHSALSRMSDVTLSNPGCQMSLSYPGCQMSLCLIQDVRFHSVLSWMPDFTLSYPGCQISLCLIQDVRCNSVLSWMPDVTLSYPGCQISLSYPGYQTFLIWMLDYNP